MSIFLSVLGLICATVGAGLMLIAAFGLLRLPDVFLRSHSAGKAATLGICLVLLAGAIHFGTLGAWARAALAGAFLLATVPVATQLVNRAAYTHGATMEPGTWLDPAATPRRAVDAADDHET
jgi:multicomponent Na+:H+ antiporter subunit G